MNVWDIVVVECRPGEASIVVELWREARGGYAMSADEGEDLRVLLAERPESVLVAKLDGVIVGALIAAWDGWRGNMYRLAVRAEHRRRGIGLALVRAGEDRLRRQGAHRITALVAHGDPAAAAFWESAGYPTDPLLGRRVRNLPPDAPG